MIFPFELGWNVKNVFVLVKKYRKYIKVVNIRTSLVNIQPLCYSYDSCLLACHSLVTGISTTFSMDQKNKKKHLRINQKLIFPVDKIKPTEYLLRT